MAGKFKLQAVLNYRQALEDQAQQALGSSLQRQRECEKQLQREQETLQEHDRELKQRQRVGMSVAEMDLFEARILHCRSVIKDLRQQLGQLAERIARQRDELLQAARERQVMEKLKEKQEAEHRLELSRRERAMLDEISLRIKGEN